MTTVSSPKSSATMAASELHFACKAITTATGSAVVEQGGTRVLCAVYGPHVDARVEFSERGRLNCEVRIAAFARSSGRNAVVGDGRMPFDEVALAEEMHTALAPAIQLGAYPKCAWQLCAFVVQDDGCMLPSLIMCGSLALADASVRMLDVVAACTVVRLSNSLQLGASAADEENAEGRVVVATMAARQQTSLLSMTGLVAPRELDEALEVAHAGCEEASRLMRATLTLSAQAEG